MQNKSDLENLLKCPKTNAPLQWLTYEEMVQVQQKMRQGELQWPSQAFSIAAIEGLLQASGQTRFYPAVDGILYLLPDLAITNERHTTSRECPSQQTKQEVKAFYDNLGWQQQNGVFKDAQDSEDLRTVSQDYILKCHRRLQQHLPATGKYLLDIASGPIQYPAYLNYSQQFQYRICADLSITALKAAKNKLQDKGIYLLCDITKLPIQDNRLDAIVSLHTLYHVPANQQEQAYSELYRTLKPQGTAVVVYSWGNHSCFMKCATLPIRALNWLKRSFRKNQHDELYFYAHNYHWFSQLIKKRYQVNLFSWRSVNVPFLRCYIHRYLAGKSILNGIYYLENRFPSLMGRIGAYPLFVCQKKSS